VLKWNVFGTVRDIKTQEKDTIGFRRRCYANACSKYARVNSCDQNSLSQIATLSPFSPYRLSIISGTLTKRTYGKSKRTKQVGQTGQCKKVVSLM